jgi:hypothetical protein
MGKNLALAADFESRIELLRGKRVLLDYELAALYGVETKTLVQSVKRNIGRFPEDFMFRLTESEFKSLRSQIVTSNAGRGGRRYLPYAFTQEGVAMLSSVLRSERGVRVNIEIMRAFVRLRSFALTNRELGRRVTELEKRYDGQFEQVFNALRALLASPEPVHDRKMGFQQT